MAEIRALANIPQQGNYGVLVRKIREGVNPVWAVLIVDNSPERKVLVSCGACDTELWANILAIGLVRQLMHEQDELLEKTIASALGKAQQRKQPH